MGPEDILHLRALPDLREPVIIAAFAGWNDASQAATFALTTLITQWKPQSFADIDPETFFDFTETRPLISLGPKGDRSLQWPSNVFFAHQVEEGERDVVLLVGTEPQLRWRAFCRAIVDVAERVDASCLVTLGGLLGDVPHTTEPRLTGFASAPRLLPQLQKLGVRMSSYEGPTGIVGALHDAWGDTGLPAISLWGNVPHYISASPNPIVALALLKRVSQLIGLTVSLSALELHATAFRKQIDEALEENPEAMEYVRQLEQQMAAERPETEPELLEELEEFLRSRRSPPDGTS